MNASNVEVCIDAEEFSDILKTLTQIELRRRLQEKCSEIQNSEPQINHEFQLKTSN